MAQSRKFFHPASRRTREFLLAKTMMVLVFVFLILNCPRLVLGLIEVTQLSSVELCYKNNLDFHIKKETYLLDFAARFLVIVNSSINFIIYCLVGSEFRQKLLTMMNLTNKTSSCKLGERSGKKLGAEEQSRITVETNISRKSRYFTNNTLSYSPS